MKVEIFLFDKLGSFLVSFFFCWKKMRKFWIDSDFEEMEWVGEEGIRNWGRWRKGEKISRLLYFYVESLNLADEFAMFWSL